MCLKRKWVSWLNDLAKTFWRNGKWHRDVFHVYGWVCWSKWVSVFVWWTQPQTFRRWSEMNAKSPTWERKKSSARFISKRKESEFQLVKWTIFTFFKFRMKFSISISLFRSNIMANGGCCTMVIYLFLSMSVYLRTILWLVCLWFSSIWSVAFRVHLTRILTLVDFCLKRIVWLLNICTGLHHRQRLRSFCYLVEICTDCTILMRVLGLFLSMCHSMCKCCCLAITELCRASTLTYIKYIYIHSIHTECETGWDRVKRAFVRLNNENTMDLHWAI